MASLQISENKAFSLLDCRRSVKITLKASIGRSRTSSMKDFLNVINNNKGYFMKKGDKQRVCLGQNCASKPLLFYVNTFQGLFFNISQNIKNYFDNRILVSVYYVWFDFICFIGQVIILKTFC